MGCGYRMSHVILNSTLEVVLKVVWFHSSTKLNVQVGRASVPVPLQGDKETRPKATGGKRMPSKVEKECMIIYCCSSNGVLTFYVL